MKRQDGRKIFANKTKNISDKGIISKIYKEHLKFNIRKLENPILKWEKQPKSQDIKEDKKVYENITKIICHLENVK